MRKTAAYSFLLLVVVFLMMFALSIKGKLKGSSQEETTSREQISEKEIPYRIFSDEFKKPKN